MSDNKKISKLDSLSDAISEFAKKKRENAEPMPTFVPATPESEGPAQERQNVGGDTKCKNCEQPKSAHWASSHIYCPISLGRACWYEPVDAATPAPSQPAGEWLSENHYRLRDGMPIFTHEHLTPDGRTVMSTESLMEAYARQQTAAFELKGWQDAIQSVRANLQQYPNVGGDIEIMQAVEKIVQEQSAAKDAEIERLHMDESPELAQVKSALATEYELRQAAEREQDSLKDDNAKLLSANAEFAGALAVAQRELAALKAGKETQE